MNILIITPGILPGPAVKGGAVETLTDFIIKDDKINSNNNITIYSIYDKDAMVDSKKINCTFKYINANKIAYKIWKLIRFIINKNPLRYFGNEFITNVSREIIKSKKVYDVVIVENVPQYGLILKKLVDSKLILHLHNDCLNKNSRYSKKILSSYDEIFVISEYLKNRVQEVDDRAKINILYNGVELNKFDINLFNKDEIKIDYSIDKESFVFMYVGRIVPEKGVEDLIKAFCKIDAGLKKNKLIMVGNTDNNDYILKLKKMAKSRINDVVFTGYIEYCQIPEICSIADVGILPTRINEAFGMVIIEFMSLGIPLIISNKGGMIEITDEICRKTANVNENYIANITKCMEEYLQESTDKFSLIKENCKKNAEKFSKERYCKNFYNLIVKV